MGELKEKKRREKRRSFCVTIDSNYAGLARRKC
jgi:hypothetical protein